MAGRNNDAADSFFHFYRYLNRWCCRKPRSITSIPSCSECVHNKATNHFAAGAPVTANHHLASPDLSGRSNPILFSWFLLREAEAIFPCFSSSSVAKAAVNFTISAGVRFSPGLSPMVPLIPDMLLISGTVCILGGKNTSFNFNAVWATKTHEPTRKNTILKIE